MPATMPAVDFDPRIPERTNLKSLTGMRPFAALLVFFIHILQPFDPIKPTGPINPFGDQDVAKGLQDFFAPAGYMGVSFFFLLSGFILTWSLRPGDRVTHYLRRRLVKIFPNHLVTWGVALVLFAGAYAPVSAWLSSLFLVNSYSTDAALQMGVNPPAWSLCSELLFYMLFPLALFAVSRIPVKRLWLWAGAMVGCTVGVGLVTTYLITDTPKNPIIPLSMTQMWFNYTFPPMRLFEFILGMLLARIVMSGRWPRIGAVPVLSLLVAGYAAALYVPAPFNFVSATIIPFGVAIAAVASADIRGARTYLDGRFMVWLGNVSFGFYMCQGIVVFWGRPALLGTATYSTPVAVLVALGFFLATLLAGWLLHTLVEKPAMRRWSKARRTPPRRDPAAPREVEHASAG
ncbi:acyltransferase [Streptomyces sp. H10-C2]|uniref:acyltransferase family protein n=1 Tax=unclassified Streptomyces TaxID=2593676 RepID=UPI0024BA9B18|nr:MULTISPECIES: acyltransferase [unclassified Streptomyces]MDJ0346851.1 acyltransferase [Streptomyces sp. PH10-H1]MDJ0372856.1 acyltransferase [Streptomyces sp. H10-C2]